MESRGARPRYVEEVSKNITVEIYGGWHEIGGNCVKVVDSGLGKNVVFDQGIRFGIYSRYYSLLIRPRGLHELRSLGIVPSPEVFRDVDDVYISHMHLDHLGVLSNIDKRNTRIYLPSLELYEKIRELEYKEWKWLLIPAKPFVEISRSSEARDPVLARQVPHSAFPSYSYIYFGSDATVLYTGDLRDISFGSFLNRETVFSYLENNPDTRVDALILEGTNIGRRHTPITMEEGMRILARYINEFGRPVFVNIDERDLETMIMLFNIAGEDREVLILDKKLAVVLDALLAEFPDLQQYFKRVLLLEELFSDTRTIPSFWSNRLASVDDLEGGDYIFLLGSNIVEALKDVRRFGIPLEGSPVLLLDSEPSSEEFLIEAKRIEAWLNIFNMIPIGLRVSGHYYPHMLREILRIAKPRKLIPVHTTAPKTMLELFNKYSAPAPS